MKEAYQVKEKNYQLAQKWLILIKKNKKKRLKKGRINYLQGVIFLYVHWQLVFLLTHNIIFIMKCALYFIIVILILTFVNNSNKYVHSDIILKELSLINIRTELINSLTSDSEKLLDNRSEPKTMSFTVDFKLSYLGFLNEFFAFLNELHLINYIIGYNNKLNKWTLKYISSNEYGYLNELKNSVTCGSEELLDNRSKPKTIIFRIDFELLYLGF